MEYDWDKSSFNTVLIIIKERSQLENEMGSASSDHEMCLRQK